MNTYEGMFLFDSTFAADFSKVEQEVARLMDRAGAETLICKKWDERKLAYEIERHKRGCYVLSFFKADPTKIVQIERDVQLSEPVLRVLILRADHMTAEDMEAAYPSRPAAVRPVEPPAEQAPAQPPKESDKPAGAQPSETQGEQAPVAVATAAVAEEGPAATKAPDEAQSVSTATEPAPEPAPETPVEKAEPQADV